MVAVPRREARHEARGVGRPEGPARAGDQRGARPAPQAHRAGRERHRQPEAAAAASSTARSGSTRRRTTRRARHSCSPTRRRRRATPTRPASFNCAAEAFANKIINLEKQIDDLKKQLLDATTASEKAKQAVAQNSSALQKKLAEREQLLSQLDQAKMQEQMNKAMTQLSETVGDEVPTFERGAQQDREAPREGSGLDRAHGHGVDTKMLEVEQAQASAEAQARLSRAPHPARAQHAPRPRRKTRPRAASDDQRKPRLDGIDLSRGSRRPQVCGAVGGPRRSPYGAGFAEHESCPRTANPPVIIPAVGRRTPPGSRARTTSGTSTERASEPAGSPSVTLGSRSPARCMWCCQQRPTRPRRRRPSSASRRRPRSPCRRTGRASRSGTGSAR